MVFFQLDLARFIAIYIGLGAIFFFNFCIVYKILQRQKNRLNLSLCGFYTSISCGLLFNFIYAPITIPETVKILNLLSNFFVFLSPVFLTVYTLILEKSEKGIATYKLLIFIIIYGILLSYIFLNPSNVKIDASTDWIPVWSIFYSIYLTTVSSVIGIIPALILSIMIYKRIKIEEIKNRWRYFLIGLCGCIILFYCFIISNTLNNAALRLIISLISISLLLWGYLMYYGVGRHIST
ncbi:MAG: hypothetical protein ACFFCE_01210 [Promethearchaeota archaeon]